MKINGYAIPMKDITPIVLATLWLGGLSWQVNSNADEIEKQVDTKERLVSIEVAQVATKEDIKEIKVEQKEQGKEQIAQGKILIRILEKVSEGS